MTKREKAERILGDAAEQLKRTIEDAPIPIIMHAEDGRVLQLSRTWTELTGYSINDVPTFDEWLTQSVYGEGANRVRDHMHELFKGRKRSLNVEFSVRTRKGETRQWSFNASSPGTLRDGRRFIVGMAVDITEQKKAEEKLREAERYAAIGHAAAMVGHDLRNPLQAVINYISLAQQELRSADCTVEERKNLGEQLDGISESIFYMDKIISDLQDYAGPLSLVRRKTDLAKLIEEILRDFRIPNNISVSTKISKNIPKVNLDSTKIKRTLINLITNAIQAMPTGGELTITVFTEKNNPNMLTLSIKDTGTGIAEKDQMMVFKPFFTTKSKGQGLGLAVCKRLVETQGGTIAFTSQEGKGTEFTVELPIS